MRAVNLLPRDDRQLAAKQQNLPTIVSTGLVVLASGLIGVFYFSAKSVAEANALELRDAQAELALLPSPAELAARTAPQRKLGAEHAQRITTLSAALSHRVAWDRVFREISLVLPEDVWLRDLNASSPRVAGGTAAPETPPGQPPTLLTIHGYTYSHDAVARLMTRLAVVPELKNVWLVNSSRAELGGRMVVNFEIRADVRIGGATS